MMIHCNHLGRGSAVSARNHDITDIADFECFQDIATTLRSLCWVQQEIWLVRETSVISQLCCQGQVLAPPRDCATHQQEVLHKEGDQWGSTTRGVRKRTYQPRPALIKIPPDQVVKPEESNVDEELLQENSGREGTGLWRWDHCWLWKGSCNRGS